MRFKRERGGGARLGHARPPAVHEADGHAGQAVQPGDGVRAAVPAARVLLRHHARAGLPGARGHHEQPGRRQHRGDRGREPRRHHQAAHRHRARPHRGDGPRASRQARLCGPQPSGRGRHHAEALQVQ